MAKSKSKNKKKSVAKSKSKNVDLKPQHKLFCNLYTKNNDLFGNATLCYAEAFGFDLESLSHEAVYSEPDEFGKREIIEDSEYTKAYNVCSVQGARLLRNVKVDEYINVLLNELMTNESADAELAWVMKQRRDLGPKIQALREFNKLKNRIITQVEINDNRVDPAIKKQSDSLISKFLKDEGGNK